jgi:hypothetical protein
MVVEDHRKMKQDMRSTLDLATWALYMDHGIGEYDNWLTMQKSRITRKDVLNALENDRVRDAAEAALARLEAKAKEIRGLLSEAL